MARRTLNRRELRAEAEAAEARGLSLPEQPRARRDAPAARPKPESKLRQRVVWAVCDVGGRTVRTFDYADKSEAEALAAALKANGKGMHFVRAVKEPM